MTLAIAIESRLNILGRLQYQYEFELIRLADEQCKLSNIPLGRFRPTDMTLTCGGDALIALGRDNNTLEWSVRVYNTRSGEEVRHQVIDKKLKNLIKLFATGYTIPPEVVAVDVRAQAAHSYDE